MILPFLQWLKYGINRTRYAFNIQLQIHNQAIVNFNRTGYNLPPPHLVFLVQWRYDLELYLKGGKRGYECMVKALKGAGYDPEKFTKILDFGCGCGRILRHWEPKTLWRLYGCDYNRKLVEWCQKNLSFAQYTTNKPIGRVDPFRDSTFDFIYASSVFTHFTHQQEQFWLSEFHRLIAPGGVALITLSGTKQLEYLSKTERARFELGHRITQRPRYAGTNICGVYHPRWYARKMFDQGGWTITGFVDAGAEDLNYQDIYILEPKGK